MIDHGKIMKPREIIQGNQTLEKMCLDIMCSDDYATKFIMIDIYRGFERPASMSLLRQLEKL